MNLADAAIRGIADRVAFRASAAPYLLLDLGLRIRAANDAYQRATHHGFHEMAGESMFEVFPDNPASPEARGVERLGESFERALSVGEADRMGLQRYDVVAGDGEFVQKSWLPVNSPITDPDGRTVGILHHVEDVTRLLMATALERDLPGHDSPALPFDREALVEALRRDSLERTTRAQMLLSSSHRVLVRASRRADSGLPE